MHRGLREDENIVFRELKNSRILKTLCTHFNDTWEAGETKMKGSALGMPCYGVFILFQRE